MRTLAVLATSLLVLLAGCGGDDESADEPAPAPAATTTTESGSLELYEVESEGFALGVPSSWEAMSVEDFRESGALEDAAEENPQLEPLFEALRQPDSPIRFIAADPDPREGFLTSVNVIVEKLPEGTEAEAYERANLETVGRALDVQGEIAQERVEVEGGEALRLEYEHQVGQAEQPLTLAVVQFVVTGETRGYVVTYTAVPSAFADYEPAFDESGRSFRTL